MKESEYEELMKAMQDPKNAEVIWDNILKFSLKMSGKIFKTMSEHEQYLSIYAKFVFRVYRELMEAGFSDEQAFELTKIVTQMTPLIFRMF